jgi:hypothetical protein
MWVLDMVHGDGSGRYAGADVGVNRTVSASSARKTLLLKKACDPKSMLGALAGRL